MKGLTTGLAKRLVYSEQGVLEAGTYTLYATVSAMRRRLVEHGNKCLLVRRSDTPLKTLRFAANMKEWSRLG